MESSFQVIAEGNTGIVDLSSALDMSTSESLLETLRQSIDKYKDIHLDASHVTRMSTPCVQIIFASAQKVENNGAEFKILNPSEKFAQGFIDLGFEVYLNKWSKN